MDKKNKPSDTNINMHHGTVGKPLKRIQSRSECALVVYSKETIL